MATAVDEVNGRGEATVSFIMEKQDDEVIFRGGGFAPDEACDCWNEVGGEEVIVVADLVYVFHGYRELRAMVFGMSFGVARVLSFLSWWDNNGCHGGGDEVVVFVLIIVMVKWGGVGCGGEDGWEWSRTDRFVKHGVFC